MWPLPYNILLDVANEHFRDFEREADQDRLAAIARHQALNPARSRPSPVRTVVARAFRALSNASHAVSEVACTAATRLEGKVT